VLLGSRARALAVFEQEDFSREGFIAEHFRGLSEKAIDNARQDLGALLAQCNEEVESVVYEHHQRFLEACKGVEDIEDQVRAGAGVGWRWRRLGCRKCGLVYLAADLEHPTILPCCAIPTYKRWLCCATTPTD